MRCATRSAGGAALQAAERGRRGQRLGAAHGGLHDQVAAQHGFHRRQIPMKTRLGTRLPTYAHERSGLGLTAAPARRVPNSTTVRLKLEPIVKVGPAPKQELKHAFDRVRNQEERTPDLVLSNMGPLVRPETHLLVHAGSDDDVAERDGGERKAWAVLGPERDLKDSRVHRDPGLSERDRRHGKADRGGGTSPQVLQERTN